MFMTTIAMVSFVWGSSASVTYSLAKGSRKSLTQCSKATHFEKLIFSGTGTSVFLLGHWIGKEHGTKFGQKVSSSDMMARLHNATRDSRDGGDSPLL